MDNNWTSFVCQLLTHFTLFFSPIEVYSFISFPNPIIEIFLESSDKIKDIISPEDIVFLKDSIANLPKKQREILTKRYLFFIAISYGFTISYLLIFYELGLLTPEVLVEGIAALYLLSESSRKLDEWLDEWLG